MDLKKLKSDWDCLGNEDPFWAILTHPDKVGRKWEIEEFFSTGKAEITSLMKEIGQLALPEMDRHKALDFGCGVGRLSVALSEHFNEVVGVDISPSMVRLAREINLDNNRCTFINNSVTTLPQIDDNSVDLVYSNITLQHIPPEATISYLKEFLRIVRPGGLVVFQLPSSYDWTIRGLTLRFLPNWLASLFRKYYHAKAGAISMYRLSSKKVLQTIQSAGGELLYMRPDQGAGEGWRSYRYFVQCK